MLVTRLGGISAEARVDKGTQGDRQTNRLIKYDPGFGLRIVWQCQKSLPFKVDPLEQGLLSAKFSCKGKIYNLYL